MNTTVRAATGHANYPGDVSQGIANEIDSGRSFGPNYMGELMWPVNAVYDPEANSTRVGFSLVAPTGAQA